METRQTGWVIIIFIVITMILWLVLTLMADIGNREMIFLYLFFPVLLIPVLLFYQLTVIVDYNEVKIRFGIGLIRKSWKISQFSSAAAVKNSFLRGWGIHYGINTTIYNVSGWKAVECKLKNSKRSIIIGSAEPEKLAAHINRMIEKSNR